jgi:hypothetical protein
VELAAPAPAAAGPKAGDDEVEAVNITAGESTALPVTPCGRGERTILKASPNKTMWSYMLQQTDTSDEEFEFFKILK